MIRTILFDLDETLYPRGAGIMAELRCLILDYIQTQFDLSLEEADDLRLGYFQTYGTTLRGLQVNHQIDPDEFLRCVHDIRLHEHLQPNPQLDAVLDAIPQDKIIFTNASREHAERVLDVLGIRQHFSRIVDVRDMEYEGKPHPSAYRRICELLGVAPEECLLVEDNIRNLCPAKEIGMSTVLVGDRSQSRDRCVDHVIVRIEEIERALVEIERSGPPHQR
jgi:putative hydrolase of the HAD superfamily